MKAGARRPGPAQKAAPRRRCLGYLPIHWSRVSALGPWRSRRRPRSAKSIFGRVAENAVPRSIFFLRYCGGDFAQNFRDARSGRDLATINHRAPRRPQRRRRKSLRSGIVPRQGRVLGIPRVVLHAPAAPRPAQGWRRTDRSPQTSVALYVWRTQEPLRDGGPARRRISPRGARERSLGARAAPARPGPPGPQPGLSRPRRVPRRPTKVRGLPAACPPPPAG